MDTFISGVGIVYLILRQKAQFLHTNLPYLGVSKKVHMKIISNLKSNIRSLMYTVHGYQNCWYWYCLFDFMPKSTISTYIY